MSSAHPYVGLRREAAYKTAQGFSPGLGDWEGALKVAPDGGLIHEEPKDAPRPPLSGRIPATPHPGLKPWAVLYSRFAAKVDTSLRDKKPMAPVYSFDPTSRISDERKLIPTEPLLTAYCFTALFHQFGQK